jgi:hypothetical protein
MFANRLRPSSKTAAAVSSQEVSTPRTNMKKRNYLALGGVSDCKRNSASAAVRLPEFKRMASA